MRTLILVSFTLFALTLGFLGYWWMQPPKSPGEKAAVRGGPAPRLAKRDTNKPYGPGKGVWVVRYSEETAQILSRFKADEYKPRSDGWVEVKNPRAQFFMKDGRAVVVEGDSGEVIIDDKANRTGMKALSGSPETPNRGRLHGVRVKLYQDIADPEKDLADGHPDPKKPALTVVLNNAAFDNQTFKIYSEAYREGKTRIESDQVPITLLGKDYDFWGRGLTIRWNERDQRLQLLEIAHGEKLVIKNPDALMKKEEEKAAMGGAFPLLEMLAAKGMGGAAEVVAADQVRGPVAPPAPAPVGGRRNRGQIPKPKISRSEAPPLYRAVFHENVKVGQGADLLVNADRMSIDFLLEDQEDEGAATRPTTQATTQPGGRAARRARRLAATRAATQPLPAKTVSGGVASATPSPVATTKPSTKPARKRSRPEIGDEPVVVTWSGKLVVEPLVLGSENPLEAGEAVIRLEGKPVRAKQQDALVECGALVYRTQDEAMLLTPVSADRPILMKDAKGAVVRTARMDYSQPKRVATLYGASDAVFPQFDESGKAAESVLAKWSKTCTLHFVGESQSEMNIERAELDGEVAVDHPQLRMRSSGLELVFEQQVKGATTRAARTQGTTTQASSTMIALGETAGSPALTPTLSRGEREKGATTRKASTRPAVRADLRQMIATGSVWCEIKDDKGRVQTIDCDRLAMLTAKTADGKLYPSTINADGQVKAIDPEQELRAGHLAIALRPTTAPTTRPRGGSATSVALTSPATKPSDTANAELQSLIAHKDVSVLTKDGARIWADQLLIDNKAGENVVKLLGQPARVVDGKNSLAGPIIEMHSVSQRLEVFGQGVMKGVQQEKEGDAEQPVEVTWVRGLIVDGKGNTVDVSGQVAAQMAGEKGAADTAKGEHVRMVLADVAPTTKPSGRVTTTQASGGSGRAVAASQPSTRPARTSQYAGMSNKVIRKVTFSQTAQISSVALGEDGSLLRRVHLEAETIEHDMEHKRMNIPVEGRMIVEEHGGATTKPASDGAGGPILAGAGERPKGTTAFKWTKSFTYDDAKRLAAMQGSDERPVVIAHKDDSPDARVFHLTGQLVTAEMEEVPSTQPAQAGKKAETKVQLKRVTAAGRLAFSGPGAQVYAKEMEFDPKANLVTMRGDARSPVLFEVAGGGGGQKQAETVVYDVKAGRIVSATRVNVRMNR